jgi:hypothetical protein
MAWVMTMLPEECFAKDQRLSLFYGIFQTVKSIYVTLKLFEPVCGASAVYSHLGPRQENFENVGRWISPG